MTVNPAKTANMYKLVVSKKNYVHKIAPVNLFINKLLPEKQRKHVNQTTAI